MNYETIRNNPTQFLSLTSLLPQEFDLLLNYFQQEWYRFYKSYTSMGKRRKGPFFNYRKDTSSLPTVADKLFFILVYYKTNPLQQFQAATFGLSQAHVSRWLQVLLPLIQQALKRLGCLACRDGAVLKEFLVGFEIQVVTQDGMEQRAARKTDQQAQEKEYSGKKKDHAYKNKVDCLESQYVVFLSPTYCGSEHDKSVADQE